MNKREKLAFAVVTFLALSGSGFAFGASVITQTPSQSIYACVSSSNGSLTKVSTKKSACSKGFKSISWNVKGAKGDQGVTGLPGIQGSKGDQGVTGLPGIQGPKGDQGLDGEQGAQGLKGDRGEQGIEGQTGPKGDSGNDGLTHGVFNLVSPDRSKSYIAVRAPFSTSADESLLVKIGDVYWTWTKTGELRGSSVSGFKSTNFRFYATSNCTGSSQMLQTVEKSVPSMPNLVQKVGTKMLLVQDSEDLPSMIRSISDFDRTVCITQGLDHISGDINAFATNARFVVANDRANGVLPEGAFDISYSSDYKNCEVTRIFYTVAFGGPAVNNFKLPIQNCQIQASTKQKLEELIREVGIDYNNIGIQDNRQNYSQIFNFQFFSVRTQVYSPTPLVNYTLEMN